MARPTTSLFTWATSVNAVTDEPPTQRKLLGWIAGTPAPAGYWNWMLNVAMDWLGFLASAPTVYTTLEEASADSSAGDVVIVDEADASAGASVGDSDHSGLVAGVSTTAVTCTGKSLIYTDGTNLKEVERSDFTVVIRTFTKTVSGTIRHIISDGNVLVLISDYRYIECLNLATGASVWTYDTGAAFVVLTACICRNRYVAGGSSAAEDVVALNLADGTVYWTFNHGAAIYGLAAAGARLFMAGHASGFASGATLRCVRLDSGAAATNEGGASVDATGTAWNQVQPDRQEHANTLATDGRALFCGMPLAAANQLEMRGCGDGEVLVSKAIANYDMQQLVVDQGFLFVVAATAGNVGKTMAFDRKSMAMAWCWADSTYDHVCCAADGAGVFVGRGGVVAPAPALYRRHRGNRPTIFRRVDYTQNNDAVPCLQTLTPSME